MNMKKLYNDVTGWAAWFFCEVAFKVFNLSDIDWMWSNESDKWVWWFRPVGWIADQSYNIGCWFYNLEKD